MNNLKKKFSYLYLFITLLKFDDEFIIYIYLFRCLKYEIYIYNKKTEIYRVQILLTDIEFFLFCFVYVNYNSYKLSPI